MRRGALIVAAATLLGATPAVAADDAYPTVTTLEQLVTGDVLHEDMAVDGDTVHLVWRQGPFEDSRQVYYQRITLGSDAGSPSPQLASLVTNLSNSEVPSIYPSIAIAGLSVHVVWVERAAWNEPLLMYRRSDDAGRSWNEPVLLASPDPSWWTVRPDVTAVGREVHIVYEYSLGVHYLRSHDRGESWERPVLVAPTENRARPPMVVDTGSTIYVAWRERGPDTPGRNEVGSLRYSESVDGVTWSEPTQVGGYEDGYGWVGPLLPEFAAAGEVLHATWQTLGDKAEGPDGRIVRTIDLMYRRSLDGGATWQEPVQLTDGIRRTNPALTVSGDNVQIVAVEGDNLVLLRSTDRGATWDEPAAWPALRAGATRSVVGDLGIHVVYRQQPTRQEARALSYAHVDLGFEPPPVPWRHIGVA